MIDGLKGALEVPDVAQRLVKPPEENTQQGQDFWGSTKPWQVADTHLAAQDVKHWLMKLTFPTCTRLHKAETTEPEVAMPTGVPNSSHPPPHLKEQVPTLERSRHLAPSVGQDLGGVCPCRGQLAAVLLPYPKRLTCAAELSLPSSPAALCCRSPKESQAWHESVCLVSFLQH